MRPDSVPTSRFDGLPALLGVALPELMQRRGDWVSLKDLESGRYHWVSPGLAEMLQQSVSQVLGRTDAELVDAPLASVWRAAEQTALVQGEPLVSDHRFESGGQRRAFSVWRMPVVDVEGRRWLCAVWVDLGPQQQREAQLRAALEQIEQQQRAMTELRREHADQALRDPASGLHRRAHLEDQLRREVDLSQREHREFALVLLAVDPPSAMVQSLGDAARLRILEAMGRHLRGGTRAMDSACRYDEERFAVLLSGVGLATAHARMEGLRRTCAAQLVVLDGQDLQFTVSVGVASFPHTCQTQDGLLQACEGALSEARRRGGNQVTLAAIRFDHG